MGKRLAIAAAGGVVLGALALVVWWRVDVKQRGSAAGYSAARLRDDPALRGRGK